MSKFNIFTRDLHVILSIIVATGIYALLLKFLQKNSPHDVQTKGGGVKGLLNNVKKTALFLRLGFPNFKQARLLKLHLKSSQNPLGEKILIFAVFHPPPFETCYIHICWTLINVLSSRSPLTLKDIIPINENQNPFGKWILIGF